MIATRLLPVPRVCGEEGCNDVGEMEIRESTFGEACELEKVWLIPCSGVGGEDTSLTVQPVCNIMQDFSSLRMRPRSFDLIRQPVGRGRHRF